MDGNIRESFLLINNVFGKYTYTEIQLNGILSYHRARFI